MTIEEEISKLKAKIRAWDASNMMGDDPEIIELRDMVIHVHTLSEAYINFLIAKHLAEQAGRQTTSLKTVEKFDIALFDLTKEVDFARLLKILQEYNIAPDFVKKLYKVNDLRVMFSHMIAKQTHIEAYKNRNKYLEALKQLSEALDELTATAKINFPDIFKI